MKKLQQISPTHFVSDKNGHYNIYMILKYIISHKIKPVLKPLSELQHFMYEDKWYSSVDKKNVSPLEVITKKDKHNAEYEKILNVDLKYPIILDSRGGFIDGAHRIAKSFLENKRSIKVYYLDVKLLKFFRLAKKDTEFLKSLTYKDLDKIYKGIKFPDNLH